MAFHDLFPGGMKLAYELIEREPVHRSATFFLRRNELVEHLSEVRLLALHRRSRGLEQRLWNVLDLGILLRVVESGVVIEYRIWASRRIVRRRRQLLFAVPNGCGRGVA